MKLFLSTEICFLIDVATELHRRVISENKSVPISRWGDV